ncbi:PepSY-associated TM helix domain-containing protein [Novosphingobium sp. LASN5T]|uniref:PepSY-associated TM helix domain-containing protein n=1 Tax=Novosphingobium sp. LASN5T TaxID=2491021 RepID=UPI00351A147B
MHTWHWISAAVSLVGMFLFAITGITLNHASSISAEPKVVSRQAMLPPALRGVLEAGARKDAPVPEPVAASLVGLVGLDVRGHAAEWNDDEVYVALPGPGRDAWVSIDRQTGEVTSERTDRGWVSYFNDLHKGRNAGAGWFWFIDVFAAACVIFTLTGLLLLQLHARHRPSTWPLVALGTAIPLVIALFFIH